VLNLGFTPALGSMFTIVPFVEFTFNVPALTVVPPA
jgi:hypothetical protein